MRLYKAIFILFSLFFISFTSFSQEQEKFIDYQFGRGLKIKGIPFRIGGYFSIKYRWTNVEEFEFNIENLALLLYGDLTKRTNFFFELEARNLYVKKKEIEFEHEEDDDDDDEYEYDEEHGYWEIEIEREFEINPEVERIYLDYLVLDSLRFRLGKFITPIGLWNPIHIPPLKWTSIDPPASTEFFPRFTTGLRVFGLLPFQDSSWEYSIFVQRTRGIDDRNNNVKTDEFYGTEIRKFFSDKSVAVAIGKFRDLSIDNKVKFMGTSIEIPYKRFRLMSEVIYGIERGHHHTYKRFSYYIQGIYRVFSKNYLIIRNDFFDSEKKNRNIKALLVGWNYRPLYPISLKIEFQIKKDNLAGDVIEFATSFSTLF